jgi:allophanate hydrolase
MAAAEAAITADRSTADPAIWITRLPDADIISQAKALEAMGPEGKPLWGLTFAVKDNIDVAGLPTTAACEGFAYTLTTSAPAVSRMMEAGAVLIGKTNLDQFATGLVGVRSPYGVPRNVFDPARVPGGSSSGSAIAVAAGIIDVSLGTDTAGSGRVPAAFGGIVGLKPTPGAVSARGMVPACQSVDTISVFARSVDRALAVLRVIEGFDNDDPWSRHPPAGYLRRGVWADGTRIATADVAALCDPEVARLYDHAAGMVGTGTIDLTPYLNIARLLYEGPWVAERTAALRRVVTQQPEIMHPVTRAITEGGFTRTAVDAFDAFHELARVRRLAETMFARYDALLLPTAPFCPTLRELEADPIGPNSRLGTFTNFANLCGMAAVAIPAGLGLDGLPVGVMLLGPSWSEGRLATIADHLHRRLTEVRQPAAAPDALAAGETALFCIGAHMAGLPLNGQVTGLGGRFLRAARTTPDYRLHALGARPGLVRAAVGAAIAGEVWALPTASIGALLAMVPPPLGFGTVTLEDGPCLGFLAEAFAVEGTPDITAHGGWRAWLKAKESGT